VNRIALFASLGGVVAAVAAIAASRRRRGPSRLALLRMGAFLGLPAGVVALVEAPLVFTFTLADGLALAGLVLALAGILGLTIEGKFLPRPRVGVAIPSRAPFHTEIRRGLAESLNGSRVDLYDDYLVSNTAVENLSDFLPTLRRTIARKPDFVVTCPPSTDLASGSEVLGLCREFVSRGGRLIYIDNPPDPEAWDPAWGKFGAVTSDVGSGARIVADFVKSQCKGGERILLLAGPGGSEPGRRQRLALEAALPNAHTVVADAGGWTSASSFRVTTRLLERYRAVRFIVCGNDVMALVERSRHGEGPGRGTRKLEKSASSATTASLGPCSPLPSPITRWWQPFEPHRSPTVERLGQ
jgi:ABC-type sugar transport system substrate-binding protein